MSGQRAAAEPYTLEFETPVASIEDRDVRLETTYFYAESGGQPADRGRIDGHPVEGVRLVDGEHVHRLATPPSFEEGDAVTGVVDEQFRTYCMRAHTASHALYGAGRHLLADLGYGGFDIGDRRVRVDFTTTTDVTDETLVELERLVNAVVWDSRTVRWEGIPVSEAHQRDDVAFNTKTEEGVFDETDVVRVVTIEGGDGTVVEDPPGIDAWDVAACGGTHVANTREIGPVTVLERSNPGEGLTRVEFAVGTPGNERRALEKRAALSASRALGTNVGELTAELDRRLEELERLRAERNDLRDRLVDARIAELAADTVERDGVTWLVGTVEDAGPNELTDRARAAAGEHADVVVLVGEDGATFLVVGSTGEPPAGEVVDTVTEEFGGGGGGSDAVAQGGGLDATPEDVVASLEEG